MARGGNDLRRKTQATELVGHPLGGPVHVVAVGGVGTDAGNTEELAQLFLEPGGVDFQVLVDGGHGFSPGSWLDNVEHVNIIGGGRFDHWVMRFDVARASCPCS